MSSSNKHVRCLIVDDEIVAREIILQLLSSIPGIEVVASCKNALEAFGVINTEEIDLIFLDINMPEISGLSLAKSINKNIKVIFTTAYREYAVDGFDLQAVDYLLKPISLERLLQAINKYKNELPKTILKESPYENEIEDHTFVRSERKMVRIDFDQIVYVESISDYLNIHLKEKNIITRETLSEFEKKLPGDNFLRIHRSYLVSRASIQSYTNEYVECMNKQLPISRSHRTGVLNHLNKE